MLKTSYVKPNRIAVFTRKLSIMQTIELKNKKQSPRRNAGKTAVMITAVKVITQKLKRDKGLFQSWQSNIAMSTYDSYTDYKK
jgi:hypothetical protein